MSGGVVRLEIISEKVRNSLDFHEGEALQRLLIISPRLPHPLLGKRVLARAATALISTRRVFTLAALFSLAFVGEQRLYAATITQTWTLQPGWNSIFVEV